jgi:hypothetical protein
MDYSGRRREDIRVVPGGKVNGILGWIALLGGRMCHDGVS